MHWSLISTVSLSLFLLELPQTANLDGETNLKIRKALEKTWDYVTPDKVSGFTGWSSVLLRLSLMSLHNHACMWSFWCPNSIILNLPTFYCNLASEIGMLNSLNLAFSFFSCFLSIRLGRIDDNHQNWWNMPFDVILITNFSHQ